MAPPIQELTIEHWKQEGWEKITKQHTKETEHGSPNENGSWKIIMNKDIRSTDRIMNKDIRGTDRILN